MKMGEDSFTIYHGSLHMRGRHYIHLPLVARSLELLDQVPDELRLANPPSTFN